MAVQEADSERSLNGSMTAAIISKIVWPTMGAVQNRQNFNLILSYSIGQDERGAGHAEGRRDSRRWASVLGLLEQQQRSTTTGQPIRRHENGKPYRCEPLYSIFLLGEARIHCWKPLIYSDPHASLASKTLYPTSIRNSTAHFAELPKTSARQRFCEQLGLTASGQSASLPSSLKDRLSREG